MQAKWDNKFIALCDHIATWSKDNSTKVGAVIVNQRNKILSIGYNGLPIGVDDNKLERNTGPDKYLWFEHAERNAIYSCAEEGIPLKGAKLYCNFLPCSDCARAIIQSGIKEVMYKEEYKKDKEVTKLMFYEAKIRLRKHKETI